MPIAAHGRFWMASDVAFVAAFALFDANAAHSLVTASSAARNSASSAEEITPFDDVSSGTPDTCGAGDGIPRDAPAAN